MRISLFVFAVSIAPLRSLALHACYLRLCAYADAMRVPYIRGVFA